MRRMMIPASHTTKAQDITPALPPTNLAWSSPAPDSVLLSWAPGTDPNSAVLRHEYSVNGSPALITDRPNGTTITGLTRDTPYEIRVRAVSAGGPSDWVSVIATTVYAPTLPGFPAAFDRVDATMRPQSGVVWQAVVSTDATKADYTDLKKAADDAFAATNNRAFNTRAVILLDVGVWTQTDTTIHEQTAVVGLSGNPADTIIQNVAINDPNLGRGAMDTWGSSYVANVTLRRIDVDLSAYPAGTLSYPKYSVHGTSGPCSIWVNCVFDVGTCRTNTGLPSVFGQDGGDGNYTLFYSCTFIGNRHDSNTNIHGGATTSGAPEKVLFVKCTAKSTGILDDTPQPSAMSFGFKCMDSSRVGDEIWVVNCSGIQFVQTGGAAAGMIVHKPDSLPLTNDSNATNIDTRTDWPQPVDWKI